MGIHIGLDYIRHTTDHNIAIQQLAHGLMNGIRDRRSRLVAAFQVLNRRFLYAVGPQIFLQICLLYTSIFAVRGLQLIPETKR